MDLGAQRGGVSVKPVVRLSARTADPGVCWGLLEVSRATRTPGGRHSSLASSGESDPDLIAPLVTALSCPAAVGRKRRESQACLPDTRQTPFRNVVVLDVAGFPLGCLSEGGSCRWL